MYIARTGSYSTRAFLHLQIASFRVAALRARYFDASVLIPDGAFSRLRVISRIHMSINRAFTSARVSRYASGTIGIGISMRCESRHYSEH